MTRLLTIALIAICAALAVIVAPAQTRSTDDEIIRLWESDGQDGPVSKWLDRFREWLGAVGLAQ